MPTCAVPEIRTHEDASRTLNRALARVSHYSLLRLDIHPSLAQRACWICGCVAPGPALVEPQRSRYFSALKQELTLAAEWLHGCGQTASIVFGAGAPALFEPEEMANLLDVVEASFGLTDLARITVEMTTGRATPGRAQALRALDVGRVTLFDMESPHPQRDPESWFEDFESALGVLRDAAFDDVGIAFFADLPARSAEERRDLVGRILALSPDRIHAHLLSDRISLDPGFRGIPAPPVKSDSVARQIRAAGYGQVAPGVFSKPERRLEVAAALEARLAASTLGFGAGALSHFVGTDFRNLRAVNAYIAAAAARLPTVELAADRAASKQ